MISAKDVSVVIPTRGDVDLTPILQTLTDFDEVIVWDNSKEHDLGIFGRYQAIRRARNTIIATQDDDLIVTCWPEILAAYEPGRLVVNYPEPWDIPWCSRGGIFDSDLPGQAFDRYLAEYDFDEYFTHYACDGIFALLTDTEVIDYGSEDLPHGFAEGRVSTSPGWYDHRRPMIQQRCELLKILAPNG